MVFFVLRSVEEPSIFQAARQAAIATKSRARWLEIFSPAILRTTILTSLLSTGAQGGYYAITTWSPTYLKIERKLSVIGTGRCIAVIIIGSFIGDLVGAYLADRIGRRANFILYAVCSLITALVYTQLPIDDTLAGAWLSPRVLRFGAVLRDGRLPYREFPTRMRGSGQGFAYNFGRGIGALNPTPVGVLSTTLALEQAIGVFAGVAYGVVVVAALLLPETRGRELTAEG